MQEKKRILKPGLALVLVLLVAITGSMIGTLARYVTSETVSDEAVVARFGLGLPTTIDLFSDSYTHVEADAADKKVVAPGTTGQYAFEVTGTSEVTYSVSAGIEVEYSEHWDGYAPLEFSLKGGSEGWLDVEAFQTALSEALAAEVLAPNTPYSGAQTLYWRWPYFTTEDNDLKDTALGQLAAAGGEVPSVTVSITVTATQID